MRFHLSRINITPVKGLALTHPDSVPLDDSGVFLNRRFFLIDDDGIMINGKRAGPLVRLAARMDDAGALAITFPDGRHLCATPQAGAQATVTDFYGRAVHGRLVDGPWNAAISAHAGRSLRLVRADDDTIATDVHPVTLISRATLDFVRTQCAAPAANWANRFRILFELDGPAAFEEDGWVGRRLAIGTAVLQVIGPVPRCPVTEQDPATGERNFDTLSALRKLRPAGPGGRVMLGMYARVAQHGTAAAGDAARLAP